MEAEDQVTVIGIGPFTNIAEAIRRRPEIVQRARFVGMCGSVRIGYRGSETPSAEYNVFADIAAAQAVLYAFEGRRAILDQVAEAARRDSDRIFTLLGNFGAAMPADGGNLTIAPPTFVCWHCGCAMVILQTFTRGELIRAPPPS